MRFLVVASALGLVLAACSSDDSSAPPTTTSADNELNVMDVKCRAESANGSHFDLVPVTSQAGKTILQGTLTDEDGAITIYECRPTADGIVTCAGQAPRWNIALQRDDLRAWRANIDPAHVESGDLAITLACTSLRSDTIAPSYATIEPYIHRACSGCHDDRFDTLEKVKAQKDIMLGMISSGQMPRRDVTWKDREEGKAVLAFLAKSHELD